MFDETWHRLVYPQIALGVVTGHYRSAFDAYCRRGALDRSAHWLFDEPAYRGRYPDLTNEVLEETGICNGYDHYLRHGLAEHRIGHLLFDPDLYLSHFNPADTASIRRRGIFQHYLNRIESAEPELQTSIYFDPDWYLAQYPDIAQAIAGRRWKCALHHYLCNDTPTAFDPLEGFSEAWYLAHDTGLAEVIESRHFRNGYMHFLQFGANELRSPSATMDLAWYAEQPIVRSDLNRAVSPNAFDHWLRTGKTAGLPAAEPEAEKITNAQAHSLSLQHATALLPITGRAGYSFQCSTTPSVSVVMVVRDGFAATMATIASLRSNTASQIELILIDCGSRDETRYIGSYLPGAKLLRFETDLTWSRAADAGRLSATAPAVLFLSSEAQIASGAVERACARLAADLSVGAIGGMILQPNGLVAQAGGILWNDGGVHDYQCGASPLAPEVNFVRDVDFCASAFLLVRTELLSDLDGFDHDCPAGYEAVDLSLRLLQSGSRTVYDPSVLVVAGNPTETAGCCGDHFQRKHAASLQHRFPPTTPAHVFARHTSATTRRVLFIEDTVPLRRIGSGFVRSNDIVNAMASLGFAVTVFPLNGCDHAISRVFGDTAETVEVMHTLSLKRFPEFLRARRGYYDTIWVARMHNLSRVRSTLIAEAGRQTRIVLDTEAITPCREAIQAGLAGKPYDLASAMAAALADAAISHQTVVVTQADAQVLRDHSFRNVSVVGHKISPRPTERPFAQRAGILFVGAIHTADSPNLDGLTWFVDAVLPLIEAQLKWETRLTIAGYLAPGVDLSRFDQHPRITLRGSVADLTPLYDSHRIFVAPTRYAAGAPYKVLEAASRGLPVVGSELLRAQLDWTAEQEMLSAPADDPAAFAASILRMYRDEAMWRTVRDRALRRLERDNGSTGFDEAIAAVLAQPI